MFDAPPQLVNEEFFAEKVPPEQLDELLALGWRHFDFHFFRYNLAIYKNEIRLVIPLRIRLSAFSLSKSLRRVIRKNEDLRVVIQPATVSDEKAELFDRHKERFYENAPSSLYDYLSLFDPAAVPCEVREICVYSGKKLLAASFFDVGSRSLSGIYAMFEPTESGRSLGILTMLKEIEFAIENGKEFYYQGYSYQGESFYDYKKRFRGSEAFDWNGRWLPLEAEELEISGIRQK